jgi:hypothetical protein
MFQSSLFNTEQALMCVARTLAAVLSTIESPCYPIKDDTNILYIIYKGMYIPFSCSTSSGTLNYLEKQIASAFRCHSADTTKSRQ